MRGAKPRGQGVNIIIDVNVKDLPEIARKLKAGDAILLSGEIYTARDAAHKRFYTLLDNGAPLPFDLKNSVIYYAGPTPAVNGMSVGACGPTTSSRMDAFAPRLMDLGVICTIGKGDRSSEVYEAIKRNGGLYLCAVGGAGALAAACIKSAEVIAYPELDCESVKRMTVERFPLYVGIDTFGHSIFKRTAP